MPEENPKLQNDQKLQAFLAARTEAEEEKALLALLEEVEPAIQSQLWRKLRVSISDPQQGEELFSTVRMLLIERLWRCKEGYCQNEPDEKSVILNFGAFAFTTMTNAINAYLKDKYPLRDGLKNRLLYIIDKARRKGDKPHFVLWHVLKVRLLGLYEWEGNSFVETPRYMDLMRDPHGTSYRVLNENPKSVPLPNLLNSLLKWLNTPAKFNDVVTVTAHWLGIQDYDDVSLTPPDDPEAEDKPQLEPVSQELTPEAKVIHRDLLQRGWQEIVQLSPQHRAALLLNFQDGRGQEMLHQLNALRIVSIREIGRTLDIPDEEWAEIWPQLPLSDAQIAVRLKCALGSVATWRLRALHRLNRIYRTEV